MTFQVTKQYFFESFFMNRGQSLVTPIMSTTKITHRIENPQARRKTRCLMTIKWLPTYFKLMLNPSLYIYLGYENSLSQLSEQHSTPNKTIVLHLLTRYTFCTCVLLSFQNCSSQLAQNSYGFIFVTTIEGTKQTSRQTTF